jgi:hypothetical protein
MREELRHLIGAEARRMLPAVELQKPPDPTEIRLLRPAAVVAHAEDIDRAVVEPRARAVGKEAQRGAGQRCVHRRDSWAKGEW